MSTYSLAEAQDSLWLARLRRFFRWLTTPYVFLSLIMVVVMFYLVIIPLWSMFVTTITVSELDLRVIPEASLGDITSYHWRRMLIGQIAKIMTYEPLVNSLVISLGATFLALIMGGGMAWLVVRTDIPGKEIIHMLATVPYIMPSWTISLAWKVIFKSTSVSGGVPGLLQFFTGIAPPTDHHCLRSALLYLLLLVRICSFAFNRFIPGRSRRSGWSQSWTHLEKDHLPIGTASNCLGFHHDLFKNHGNFWRPQRSGCSCRILYALDHVTLEYGDWKLWRWLRDCYSANPVFNDDGYDQSKANWDTSQL